MASAPHHGPSDPLSDTPVMQIHWADLDSWKILSISENVRTLLGERATALLNGAISYPQLLHPDDRELLSQAARRFQETSGDDSLYHEAYRLLTGSEAPVWILARTTRVRNGDGTVRHYSGSLIDISAWQQPAHLRREDRERLSLALDGAGLGTWDWDIRSGRVVFDRRWTQMLGYRPDDILPHVSSWEDLVHPEDKPEVMARLQAHLNGCGDLYRTEHRLRTKSGSWLWILDSGRVISRDAQGRPLRMAGIHQDINERKTAERKQRELEAQLRQKFKMEAVGAMAGGVAHNFNNSLAVILGSIELAQLKQAEPDTMHQLLEDAKTAILRSRDLVQQLLTYSRKGIQERTAVRVTALLAEVRGLLESVIPASVELRIGSLADSWISADPGRIEDALLSLCSNAVHAMDEQGVLTLAAERVILAAEDIPLGSELAPGACVRLSMTDTGHGMNAETLEKIFDPFFTTKAVNEGIGMGLSTVQGIIEQHGGLIKVRSTPGRGASFELYFPEITPPTEQLPPADSAESERDAIRVLFVDDDPALAELGRMMLEELGYRVTATSDSHQALELVSNNPQRFDLVVADQVMPRLSGSELVRKLRAIRPELPTVLCTGYSQRIDRHQAEQLGAAAYCMKPLELSELAGTIRKVLGQTGR